MKSITPFEMKIDCIERYETLRNMFRCSCNYVKEKEPNNKEQLLMQFSKYFSVQKRLLDEECMSTFEVSLLSVILELRPDLLDDEDDVMI